MKSRLLISSFEEPFGLMELKSRAEKSGVDMKELRSTLISMLDAGVVRFAGNMELFKGV